MKKVKELKKWIELYGEVHAAAEELELAYEYVKEEIITEEEVDAAYKKALHLLEDLEFRNMLRDEADQMSCVLKINSGRWYREPRLGFHVDAYVSALG